MNKLKKQGKCSDGQDRLPFKCFVRWVIRIFVFNDGSYIRSDWMEKIKLAQEQNRSIQEILNQPGKSKEYLLVTHTECTVLRSNKCAERHEENICLVVPVEQRLDK